ncbi:ATP-binding protein [Aquimarina sp. ERC-38]|uniref:PAS domain-containing hybrid sensor histidine kinase/response regulator n=1 Tax=Aquimarina sp. ERC-38 TaxID=2949996 RepID=UPI002247B86E|nr:ATP-binding protein [Aquimarina sp. ERC-38]UZO80452.1 ATP-binding protein [Aquimarina sp. ERC-38]
MLVNWFKERFIHTSLFRTHSSEEHNVDIFIKKLCTIYKVNNNSETISVKVQEFYNASLSHKISLLPELYLDLEQVIINSCMERRETKKTLRTYIETNFPLVLKYTNFNLIFKPFKEQEKLLCGLFQMTLLNKFSEIGHSYNHPAFSEIKSKLEPFCKQECFTTLYNPEKFNALSLKIYQSALIVFGTTDTTTMYLEVYQYFFKSYFLLDSFTSLLQVIPKEIFGTNLINLPSKPDMLRMLQNQLVSIEEVNDQLNDKIQERDRIEEDLKQSERIKARILDTAMDGIILSDQEGIVLDWNKQAENILKVKKEETIGKSIYRLVPRKLREQLKNSFSDYVTKGKGDFINKRIEREVILKDNSKIYVELTIVAIHVKGEVLFNSFFRDITDRKIIELEIKEAKKIAEKSALAKATFLSNMSHEIRTPLNVILGLTNILQKSGFSNIEQDQKNLDGIKYSAENLLVLINDILDFSKIEAGKLTIQPSDFNILESIDNLTRGFLIKAHEKGIQFKTEIDPELPKFIKGDQHRLHQILTNLLGNAIKFTKHGCVTLQIKLKETTFSGMRIQFSIIDTGLGIPEEKLERIFESFYQVHAPGKHKFEGTGLGLSISRQLIELQGGILEAESTINVGSTFTFQLNYEQSKFIPVTKKDSKNSSRVQTDLPKKMKILVVEDNKMNSFFLNQLLTNWNLSATVAMNGVEALQLLENDTFDVILMDMHMPVMDGLETTSVIRNHTNPLIRNIPVICCSADVYPEAKKAALEVGMDYYLTKPIHEEALEKLLATITQSKPLVRTRVRQMNRLKIETPQVSKQKKYTYCNFNFIESTFRNDPNSICSVLQMFMNETPKDFEDLRKYLKAADQIMIKETAHKIKSSYHTFGIYKEAEYLQDLENVTLTESTQPLIMTKYLNLQDSLPHILKEIEERLNAHCSLQNQ